MRQIPDKKSRGKIEKMKVKAVENSPCGLEMSLL
jgi:hypothetical protein